MPAFVRSGGQWVESVPRVRSGGAWTDENDQFFARVDGEWKLIYPDPAAVSALLPPEGFVVTSGPDHQSVTVGWTNPTQPTVDPTDVQVRIAELGSVWTEYAYPITEASWGALDASTTYVAQVRYVRRVDGVVVLTSATRTVEFTTTAAPLGSPAPDPGGTGGDSIIPIGGSTGGTPGSPGATDACWWEISVQQLQDNAVVWDDSALNTETSDDGSTMIADEVAGNASEWSVDFASLTAGTIVRICRREACDTDSDGTADTFGDWECGLPFPVPTDWDAICGGFADSTNISGLDAVADAVFRYPYLCKNSDSNQMVMLEEVSGVELGRGPGFYSFFTDDAGEKGVKAAPDETGSPWLIVGALTAVASMFVAEADWTVVSRFRATSDFTSSNGRTATIGAFGGVATFFLEESATGWTPNAVVITSDGIKTLTGDEIAYDEATTHTVAARWDDDGDLELFVDGVSVDTLDVSALDVYETDGLAAYNGAPGGLAIMQQIGWDRALTDEELNSLDYLFPSAFTQTDSFTAAGGTAYNFDVDTPNKMLYWSNATGGIQAWDFSDPANVALIGQYYNGSGGAGVTLVSATHLFGRYQTTSAIGRIWSYTAGGVLTPVSDISGDYSSGSMVARDGYAYGKRGTTFWSVNCNTPGSLVAGGTATLVDSGNARLSLDPDTALVAVARATATRVELVSVATPGAPALVGSITGLVNVRNASLVGQRLYVLDQSGTSAELRVYDVSNPGSPSLLGTQVISYANGLHVERNRAYIGRYQALDVWNVTDPTSMVQEVNSSQPAVGTTSAREIQRVDNLLLVQVGNNIYVFEIS